MCKRQKNKNELPQYTCIFTILQDSEGATVTLGNTIYLLIELNSVRHEKPYF